MHLKSGFYFSKHTRQIHFDIVRYIYQKDMKSIYDKYAYADIDYEVIELVSIITDNHNLLNLYNNQNRR